MLEVNIKFIYVGIIMFLSLLDFIFYILTTYNILIVYFINFKPFRHLINGF